MLADEDLDRLLDTALATYSGEPMSGLEERILSRTPGDVIPARLSLARDWKSGVASAFRWRIWVPAAAVLLAAAILPFYIRQARHAGSPTAIERGPSPLSTRVPDRPREAATKAPFDFPPTATHRHLSSHRSMPLQTSEQPKPLPKQDIFPTPVSLSPQEQALESFVNKSPEEAKRSITDTAKNAAEPIRIVALKIPPLSPPDHGGN